MLSLLVTYSDGRTEVIDHPDDTILADLASHFSAKKVEILHYMPVLIGQLEEVVKSFESGPPETDYQRGYLYGCQKWLGRAKKLWNRS